MSVSSTMTGDQPGSVLSSASADQTQGVQWRAVVFWSLAGAIGGLGFVSLASIGLLILPVFWGLVAVGVTVRRLRGRSAVGLTFGLGLLLACVAWLNRTEGVAAPVFFNPVVYLTAALVVIGVGVGLIRRWRTLGARRHEG